MGATESQYADSTKDEVPEPVYLHIYDLGDSAFVRSLNGALRGFGSGAYHVGVEVYGQEWSYASMAESEAKLRSAMLIRSGISWYAPRTAEGHTYRETVSMGHTSLTKAEVFALTMRLGNDWRCDDYDMLTSNCCHFCDFFCRQMGVGPIPERLTSLAALGFSLLGSSDTAGRASRGADSHHVIKSPRYAMVR